jgi:hypothetical protein
MVYVETGDFKGLVISYATKSGTELWCYDVEDLKLRKMGVLDGVIDLVGLSVLTDDLGVTLPENPDDSGDTGLTQSDYVYGYVKTSTGYVWAKINTETMAFQVLTKDETGYGAGAAFNGKLWVATSATKYGNTTYTFQELDPGKNYAMNSIPGSAAHTNGYNPADFAGVPSVDVTLVDSSDGQTYTKTMGGYMIDAANGKYSSSKPMLFLVKNYRSFTTTDSEIYFAEKTFADKFAAIVYTGSEISEDNKLYYDNFLILDQSGNLYDLQLTSCLKNGKVTLNTARTVSKLGKLDVTFKNGASMARVTMDKVYVEYMDGTTESIYPDEISFSVPEGVKTGGCYVATAVYGSYDCPQVWTLRRYRDNILAKSFLGRAFIKTYYAVSPTLVKWFGETKWFKNLWRGKLDRMVEKLRAEGVESTPYEDKVW